MKAFLGLFLVLAVLAVVAGPVLVAQAAGPVAQPEYTGVHLADVPYTEVSFPNQAQGIDLAGMLLVPEGQGPFPAAVIIQGAGTSVRDNIWYLTLASHLQEHGVAVLLPDKRGSVKAGGDWHTSSYEDLATDSVAAIDYLKGQDLVDVSAIGLIGMSQGGQLAPLVVHQAPDVAFLLDVVGTSLSSYDVLYYEETNNLRELGFLPGISDLIAYPSTYVLRKFTQRDFWDAVGDFDALPYWQELSIPTLVMYGSDDPNVPARASKARLDALDKENITVKIYEGSGHALQDPPGRGNRIFRQEALDDIVDFIGSVVPLPITFAEPRFVFQGDDPSVPIVTHDPSPEIENRYINPGALLFHDGQYHMFFNSFTLWPGVVQVGHMASADGVRWQMVQDAPVFATDQIPFGRGKADVSSVVVMDDGTWTMYFHTVSEGEIGLATASSPLGPWTVRPEPVLGPGPSGAWDQNGLGWPDVVRDGDDYFMFYGAQGQGGYAIGLATSSDGFHWTKYDDTETGEEPLAESDPVLTAAAKWESNRVDRPRVVLSPDGWVMLYQGGPFVDRRGLAMSNDGVHWETYAANPIFSREVFPIPNAKTWDTALLYRDGTYHYYMEIGTLDGTDLYLATHQGPLRTR